MAARAVAPIGKFIFLLTTQALASDVSPWIVNGLDAQTAGPTDLTPI